MGSLNCCKLRTCVLLIGAAFLIIQTAMLVLNFFAMRDVAGNVEAVVGWFRAKADELGDEDADEDEDTVRMLMAIKEAIVKVGKVGRKFQTAYTGGFSFSAPRTSSPSL